MRLHRPASRVRPDRPRLPVGRVAAAALAAGLLFAGCRPAPPGTYQGYLEGEYVYAAVPLAGQLTVLHVARGQQVARGQPLFELEHGVETAALREAGQRLAQASNRLANLRKGLRPSELAALTARGERASANLRLSERDLERQRKLIADRVIAPSELDAVLARRDADAAEVEAIRAELETARLGAREDEIRAAEADVASLDAVLAKARWALDQKQPAAPVDAIVHDTLYRAGEYVTSGMPVVSLLPPANLKVRFFVPQSELGRVRIGGQAQVSFDGAPAPVTASIAYVSTQPEFTPPVIYSRENRAKLVFMVEATLAPEQAAGLHPGQPVDVRLLP